MLIRSQDRKTLVNLDCVQALDINEPRVTGFDNEPHPERMIVAYLDDDSLISLGTYSTEQKAMDVLDDLSQTYFLGRLKFSEEAVVRIQDGSPVVYWMPEDSEVEDE